MWIFREYRKRSKLQTEYNIKSIIRLHFEHLANHLERYFWDRKAKHFHMFLIMLQLETYSPVETRTTIYQHVSTKDQPYSLLQTVQTFYEPNERY